MEGKLPITNLNNLKTGCLLRNVKKEIAEPENAALGQISHELSFFQRQSQYAGEMERVLKEMNIAIFFIKNSREAEVAPNVTRQDLLIYHYGHFLSLVYQMKEKIIKLVDLITEDSVPKKSKREKVKLSTFAKNKSDILKNIGIETEIKQWDRTNIESKIADAIRKRDDYTHYVSGLIYNKDFLNMNFTDIATNPNFQINLSDFGKEHINKMRTESEESLFSGMLKEAEEIKQAVEQNIEKISGSLVEHFKLLVTPEETKKIIDDYLNIQRTFDVINKSSIEKVKEPFKTILDKLIEKIRGGYSDNVASIYLVGSLGRGEYEEGYSDVNIYIILNEDDESGLASRDDFMINLTVFTKKHFLSEKCLKYRVIAKSDGVLLYGEDLVSNEKLPKAGMFLALALNDDILENLNNTKKWMDENPHANQFEISKKSRKLAKRIIDFMYGVAITNKPHFTASRQERLEKVIEAFGSRNVMNTLMGISRYGVGDFESLKNTIEGLRGQIEVNLEKMIDVKTKLEDRSKDKKHE